MGKSKSMQKYKNSKVFQAWEEIEKYLETQKLSWWIRFLLFFKKSKYGIDWGYGFPLIICVKKLFGKCYIRTFLNIDDRNYLQFEEKD